MFAQQYVQNQTRENVQLLFKKGNELQQTDKCYQQLSVTISALLNSGGGTIVYGIEAKKHKAAQFSWVNNEAFSRDWLNEAVKGCVEPQLADATIEYDEVEDVPSQLVVRISVPSSTAVPHRAIDKQYYRRNALNNLPMEEYEIRALYQRSTVSELEFYAIMNTGAVPQLDGGRFSIINFYPQFLVKNISAAIEHFYKIEFHIPTPLHNPNYSVLQQHFSHFEDGNTVFSVSNKNPLFQNEIATVLDANICVDAHSAELFETGLIQLKLFYSTGVKIKHFKIRETFLYKGQMISVQDFAPLKELW